MMELCRICGNPGILDIFNQFNDDSVSLAEKINSFLTFQVNILIFQYTYTSVLIYLCPCKYNKLKM